MCAKNCLVLTCIVFCWFRDAVAVNTTVSVVWKQIPFNEFYKVTVNHTIEYIIEVTPKGNEGSFPSRVALATTGGDITRPVLITARQNTGAQTWQLPYDAGGSLEFKLERTLCILNDVSLNENSVCDQDDVAWPRGQFSLHIASSCSANLVVNILVTTEWNWRLPFNTQTTLFSTQGAPALRYYNFTEDQDNVRLIFSSNDEACATVAVLNYTCPIPQTLEQIGQSGIRMTVQRSGGVQLSRRNFPKGFVVMVIVQDNDVECNGKHGSDGNYLWEIENPNDDVDLQVPRSKDVKLTLKPALTKGQYAVATIVLTVIFLSFYLFFGFFVFMQRIPCWSKLVGSKAVLEVPVHESENDVTELHSTPYRRQRNGSIGTLDNSDNSDSDDEEAPQFTLRSPSPATPAPGTPRTVNTQASLTANGIVVETQMDNIEVQNSGTSQNPSEAHPESPRPFGLPSKLNLADLARRKPKTHEARSDRYLNTLYTVAVFYTLPVVQFVAAFQMILNVSGNLDLCYYNFLCAHPAGVVSDFNHVYSNLGYLLLGALFMFQVRRRRSRRKKILKMEDYGIPPHYGLLSALGAGMMVVALLSASYHICPNQLNFQFDTAFMYVLAVLSMVKIYQSRHPDVNARAHATFGVLAILIALVVWGVLGGGALFWAFFTVVHIITFLVLSLRIYYVGQFHLDKEGITEATRGFREVHRPLYTSRLVLLVIANALNWVFAIYGLLTMSADFAGHLLQVLLGNTLMYMMAYIILKLVHGERLRWYSWVFLVGATLSWAPSLYFFIYGNSSWESTPAQSRHKNHECKVLEFYDSHDLWHVFSAISLYLTFNVLLTWDDGLSAVKRTDIDVF